jgi:hypothetical protein
MAQDGPLSDGKTPRFHRLVPPLIGEMAVIRTQVYWYPGSGPDWSTDNKLPKLPMIEDSTFKGWSARKSGRNPFWPFDYSEAQPSDRMKYVYVWWRSMLAHVRIQRHTEYLAIITSLNFSRNMEKGAKGAAQRTTYFNNFNDERNAVQALFDRLARPAPAGQEEQAARDKEEAQDTLLGPLEWVDANDLFAAFDSDFNMPGLHSLVLSGQHEEAKASAGGVNAATNETEMILDLRGLVTSSPKEQRREALAKLFRRDKKLFQPCFDDRALPERADSHLLADFDQKAIEDEELALSKSGRDPWYLGEIGRYWRAVQPDVDSHVKHSEAIEFSATGLLDGRALFITYMAAPPASGEEMSAADLAKPSRIRFFLHCRRSDERQIGRMVDRLCTMTTVRAALDRHAVQILAKRKDLRLLLGSIEKSMDGLIFQNRILNRIILKQEDDEPTEAGEAQENSAENAGGPLAEETDEEAPRSLQGQLSKRQADTEEDVKKEGVPIDYFTKGSNRTPLNDQSSRDVLRAISRGMNELEQEIRKKLKSKPRDPSSGKQWGTDDYMEYQVERAAYYSEKFRRLAEQVRIARLEGFQTYPELIQRRMQDAFSYVQNVREYLREIAEQRTRMSNQIGNITQIVEAHESDEEQRKIAEIQDFAEFALLTFLLPYYFGYILKETAAKFGGEAYKYEFFFWLIIGFTVLNLLKRMVERKFFKWKFWVGPKMKIEGSWASGALFLGRKIGWILSSINVLSMLAIAGAAFILWEMRDYAGAHAPSAPGAEEAGCTAPACPNAHNVQLEGIAATAGAEQH